jgi:hypothetical protein
MFLKELSYFTIITWLFLMEGKQNFKHGVHFSDVIFSPNYTKLISAFNSILILEALCYSDKSVPTYPTTRCHNSEDHNTVTSMSEYRRGLDW